MKQLLLSLFLITGLFFSAAAQQQDVKYKVSIGGEYLTAAGASAEYLGSGYGASIQGEYNLLPKLNVTVSAAYLSLGVAKLYKEIYEPWYETKFSNAVYYPVKAGAKYFFYKNFYAAAEGGASITKVEGKSTLFIYTGALGSTFKISPKSSLDLAVRYETWALSVNARDTFLGIRAAYAFGFGK